MKPFLILILLAMPTLASGPASAELRLFNGKDLDGWVAEGVIDMTDPADKTKKVPVWTVKDGNIHCAGKGFGFLRYAKQEFGDFHFHVEYRMLNKTGNNNSG